ncbi:OmpH family outer membrane protein [Commensalibacter communis]|uniref:OmpH family outer membrane protein n=1 Tax=Commensalibacter communis TaxID=2972786 RepID=UPI0022FF68F5|nr:OmpH family outer membrane protein [Commensalibacter communis]CAI3948402.1 Periplasmic chaperone for outer membrane proteins [Commensalibacter communis]CAI3948645.1 Periplasmic chaperone for outer membrane proteins [Commensalibacter communis]
MVNKLGLYIAVAGAFLVPSLTIAAHAEDANNGWFIPKNSQPKPVSTAPKAAVKHTAAPRVMAPAPTPADEGGEDGDMQNQPQAVLPLPPVPKPAPLPKSTTPPTAVIGVISVPDVMRQSVAAREAEKVLVERRDQLQKDVQKEQKAWRAEQQQIQAKAKTMTDAQLQERGRKLQARVMNAQKDFRNRSRIIQESAQVAFGQVERELILLIQNVAESHNMNLVLHREQVALSVNELDISNEVAKELNKNLSSVFIPAADVDPEELAKSGSMPTTVNPDAAPKAAANSVVKKAPEQQDNSKK